MSEEDTESEQEEDSPSEDSEESLEERCEVDEVYLLADRHGYNDEGVDTLHRDIVDIIAREFYGINLSEAEMTEILGESDNPNNIVDALEAYIESVGIEINQPDECDRVKLYILGDVLCSRLPGEMKTRNVVGKAAKAARESGKNQYIALIDLLQSDKDPEKTRKTLEKISKLTKRRFESLSGVQKYLSITLIIGNADLLPSKAIEQVAPYLETPIQIYRYSGVFDNIVETPQIEYLNTSSRRETGLVMIPYTSDFHSAMWDYRNYVKPSIDKESRHLLLSHETLQPGAVGASRNVEGRELYNYAIDSTRLTHGFSADTHMPVTHYHHYVGKHSVSMTQISTNALLQYCLN